MAFNTPESYGRALRISEQNKTFHSKTKISELSQFQWFSKNQDIQPLVIPVHTRTHTHTHIHMHAQNHAHAHAHSYT